MGRAVGCAVNSDRCVGRCERRYSGSIIIFFAYEFRKRIVCGTFMYDRVIMKGLHTSLAERFDVRSLNHRGENIGRIDVSISIDAV